MSFESYTAEIQLVDVLEQVAPSLPDLTKDQDKALNSNFDCLASGELQLEVFLSVSERGTKTLNKLKELSWLNSMILQLPGLKYLPVRAVVYTALTEDQELDLVQRLNN